MKRYLLIHTMDNKVFTTDEIDYEYLDELCKEIEIIDLLEMKFYRPSGWIQIKQD